MRIEYKILIFSFIFYCEFILNTYMNLATTWSSSSEEDQNRPFKQKFRSSMERLAISENRESKQKGDRKGKGHAVESSSTRAVSPTKDVSKELQQWSDKDNKDLARYFYTYQTIGAYRGSGVKRDWDVISDFWNEAHDNISSKKLKNQAFGLRDRMHTAAYIFDTNHPEGGDIYWTGSLNDDLMKMYYATEAGDKSKHGERMLAEWVRMKYPNYNKVTPGYLLDRAKAMLQSLKKTSPLELLEKVFIDPGETQRSIWTKEIEDYLEQLWNKYDEKTQGRRENIFYDAVDKFKQLESVGLLRVYRHARWVHDKRREPELSRVPTKKKMHKKDREEFMIDDLPNWKPHHDEYLPGLWKGEKKETGEGRLERFYHKAVQKFPELGALRPKQVYDRMCYLKKRTKRRQQAETANQEMMQETHVPYHHFIDDESALLLSQRSDHHHEWMASTSSHPGPSHGQPDLELGLSTLDSGDESPETNLRLG